MMDHDQIARNPQLHKLYLAAWAWADHRDEEERRIAASGARWMNENPSLHDTDRAYNIGLIDRHEGRERLYANY